MGLESGWGSRKSAALVGREVETVRVHDLGPSGDEIFDELLSRVAAAIDFGDGAELGVRSKDEIDGGCGPFQIAGLAIAAFIEVLANRCQGEDAGRETQSG